MDYLMQRIYCWFKELWYMPIKGIALILLAVIAVGICFKDELYTQIKQWWENK